MYGRRDIEVPVPTGREGERARRVFRQALLAIVAGMDDGESLAVSVGRVLRAIAVAMLP